MGAKAMSSHGSAAGGGGALSRQGSVCSLTFSEVDGQLHGVNLDDLLRAAGSAASAGRKTVDEVWRDIQGAGGCLRPQMTLEDFLCRAGAPADAVDTGSGCAVAGAGARGWAQQQYQPAPAAQLGHPHHHPVVGRPVPRPRPLGVGAGPVLDALYHDGHAGRPRGRRGGEVERAAQEADDQEPGVGGEVARAEAGVHERAGEQDLAAGEGEQTPQEAQGIGAGSAVCAAAGDKESAPAD